MRIVFFGTPKFASTILESLIKNNHKVVLVVSQPDKKIGRRQELKYTPVKEIALKNKILVFQPIKIRNNFQEIIDTKPDLIITVAYGQILPYELLKTPTMKSINIHASLLPKYRGGAPIHWAVINGDIKTGITIIEMIEKMDAGDIIAKKEIDILENETTEIIHKKLMKVGIELIEVVIKQFKNNKVNYEKQNEDDVIFAPNISREDEKVLWNKISKKIHNKVRGLYSVPIANGIINNKVYKIHETRLTNFNFEGNIGEIKIIDNSFFIKTRDGAIEITKLQAAGKKVQTAKEFINGYRG